MQPILFSGKIKVKLEARDILLQPNKKKAARAMWPGPPNCLTIKKNV
jgi:hypothetical protein